MSNQRYLLRLLKLLEERVPPLPHTHHAVMYGKYGNEEDGWQDKLIMQLSLPGILWKVMFEEGDFKKTPAVLVEDIIKLLPIQIDPRQFDIACRLE